jgi:hypothetical protein
MNASNGYEITLNKIDLRYDTTLQYEEQGDAGQLVDIPIYYQGRIVRLGISATGSTWTEALENTIIAASASPFDSSF